LEGQPFLAGDIFRFFSSRPQNTPCFIGDRKGKYDLKFFNLRADGTPFFAPVWFGNKVGVTGIDYNFNYENYLHLCHTTMAEVNEGLIA
jgi:hypothetical protein